MAEVTLSELLIDDATWGSGSAARRAEWRLAIEEILQEGRFELADGASGPHRALLSLEPTSVELVVRDGEGRTLAHLTLPLDPVRPLMAEYLETCVEMGKLGVGDNSPRLEALDIAKRLTHDEAGETVRGLCRAFQPDHATGRRIFTLLVTLVHDTTKLAIAH